MRKERVLVAVATLMLINAVLATGSEFPSQDNDAGLDTALHALVARARLTGDPVRSRVIPSIREPLAQLGMKLFFTKGLSGELDTACATCHHPLLGGGDTIPLSIGSSAIDPDILGKERRHTTSRFFYNQGPTVGRNAPTIFNIALWDSVLFLDGRVESLGKTPGYGGADGKGIRTPDSNYGMADARANGDMVAVQARFPVVQTAEMLGKFGAEDVYEQEHIRTRLAGRLGNYGKAQGEIGNNGWLTEFQQAFGKHADAQTLITFDNVAEALAVYQRSQVFVASPWNAYVKGNAAAISARAKRGAILFYRPAAEGGAQCSTCHRGDFFTDESFHVIAIPQVGRGKGNGPTGDDDFGRYRSTTIADDKYKFRTPTLLNVEVTAPYGHSGAYDTLEGIIRHHLDPQAAFEHYDTAQLAPDVKRDHMVANTEKALNKLADDRAAGKSLLVNLSLTDEQVLDLAAFLRTLTDPCVRSAACLSAWVPTGVDPDGLMLKPALVVTAYEQREN